MANIKFAAALVLAALLAAGCTLVELSYVQPQQKKIDEACRIEGTVRAEDPENHPLVVVLARLVGTDPRQRSAWQVADHFVLDQPGHWIFFVPNSETYGVVAFEDKNGDLIYQADEPYLQVQATGLIACKPGATFKGYALVIPENGRPLDAAIANVNITALQARSVDDQAQATLGQLTVAGEVTTMDDPRFADGNGMMGLWRPFDFMQTVRPGVYFLEPYDPHKIPVLFVHGITGTPTNFTTIVKRLDRSKFQPWMYYYPSGAHLGMIADHLNQTMMSLEARYGVRKFFVVSHSMGGLVSRGFILRHNALATRSRIPLFVSLSAPFGGHTAATLGVKMSPAVVRVWEDMAPDSDYLRSLYYRDKDKKMLATIAPATTHHLLFSFRHTDTITIGDANDDTATLTSQLVWEAQRDAVRLYGLEETHMSILDAERVTTLLGDILAQAAKE
ncbi:MAG TPA: hypothetical protein VHB46_06720 [Burkholderiales bacterium]|nr:hypothetical protein [Burkholderiales bacterium]